MTQDKIKLPWNLLEVVAGVLKMELSDYKKKSRAVYYVDLRRIGAMLLKRTYPSMTLSEIGDMFGQDHSTIINYLITGTGYLQVVQQPFMSKYVACEEAVDEWIATPNSESLTERKEIASSTVLNYRAL